MPHEIGSDGYFRLETTRYLALGQIIDQPTALLMSVLALPLYAFGDIVALFNTYLFLAGLAVMAALLWNRVPPAFIRRLCLVLIAASMFGHHAQLFFGEVLTAMFVAIGILLMATNRYWPGLGMVMLGVINTAAAIPALFLMLVARARPPYRVWQGFWPAAVCVLALLFEWYLRRGDPFNSGYQGDHGRESIMPFSGLPGFSYPFVLGVLSILFSYGKGLALFTPGLWLLLQRAVTPPPDVLRRLQRDSMWFVLGLVLVYAKWWAWPGGWFWGPRFFLFACIPASVALAWHLCDQHASARAKALTLLVLGWSVWVGIDGLVYGQLGMEFCNTEADLEPLCWYAPEFSALFRPFIQSKTLNGLEQVMFTYSAVTGIVLALPFTIDLLRYAREQFPAAKRWFVERIAA